MRPCISAFAVLLPSLLIGIALTGPSHAADTPNIVIILADDMGWGDPACNNPASKMTTPNINKLAKEGLRFTDAHSPASWCTPTRYGLMTGRYPFRTELKWRNQPVIEEGRLTLPAMLKEHGYSTVMVGKWHLGFEIEDRDRSKQHRGGPIDRGFDRYFGIPSSLDIPPFYYIEGDQPVAPPTETVEASDSPGWSPIQGAFWRKGGIAPGFKHLDVLPELTKRVEKEIQDHHFERGSQPLFLYMPLPAPHTPWMPTREFAGKSDVPLYGDFIQQVDDTVGRVMRALDGTGMSENTLFIFSSDNGPVWYETDEVKYKHKSTANFRGMKGDAWEGGHRMPLIVRWPRKFNETKLAGKTTDQLACLTDIFATCASIVGHELPRDSAEDSIDFSETLLEGKLAGERSTLVVNSTGDFLMVRDGSMKLIPFRGSGGFSKPKVIRDVPEGEPTVQLYDLKTDPSETENLAAKREEDAKRLAKLLAKIQKDGRTRE